MRRMQRSVLADHPEASQIAAEIYQDEKTPEVLRILRDWLNTNNPGVRILCETQQEYFAVLNIRSTRTLTVAGYTSRMADHAG